MPDISLLPDLVEIFGISIDELFDLTTEQKIRRIENRMDNEEELDPLLLTKEWGFSEETVFHETEQEIERLMERALARNHA